jgi:hypothetical protein
MLKILNVVGCVVVAEGLQASYAFQKLFGEDQTSDKWRNERKFFANVSGIYSDSPNFPLHVSSNMTVAEIKKVLSKTFHKNILNGDVLRVRNYDADFGGRIIGSDGKGNGDDSTKLIDYGLKFDYDVMKPNFRFVVSEEGINRYNAGNIDRETKRARAEFPNDSLVRVKGGNENDWMIAVGHKYHFNLDRIDPDNLVMEGKNKPTVTLENNHNYETQDVAPEKLELLPDDEALFTPEDYENNIGSVLRHADTFMTDVSASAEDRMRSTRDIIDQMKSN